MESDTVHRELCHKCKVIWRIIELTLRGLSVNLNRTVSINIDDVVIKKNEITRRNISP